MFATPPTIVRPLPRAPASVADDGQLRDDRLPLERGAARRPRAAGDQRVPRVSDDRQGRGRTQMPVGSAAAK